MLYALFCVVMFVFDVYLLCDLLLGATGWDDPKERKAAAIGVMIAALLNSDNTPKSK